MDLSAFHNESADTEDSSADSGKDPPATEDSSADKDPPDTEDSSADLVKDPPATEDSSADKDPPATEDSSADKDPLIQRIQMLIDPPTGVHLENQNTESKTE